MFGESPRVRDAYRQHRRTGFEPEECPDGMLNDFQDLFRSSRLNGWVMILSSVFLSMYAIDAVISQEGTLLDLIKIIGYGGSSAVLGATGAVKVAYASSDWYIVKKEQNYRQRVKDRERAVSEREAANDNEKPAQKKAA